MLNNTLAAFYERDIHKLAEEVKLFKDEKNIWKVYGSVKNTSGNLVLHIIGGLNYFIGANLGQTGYVRNRQQEFALKGVDRATLVAQLEALIPMIHATFAGLGQEQMEGKYTIMFDDADNSTSYVLIQLLLHLNYHLGQVNYLRRGLE